MLGANDVEKQSTKKIALGTVLGYLALLLSIASGLLFTPLIKRNLGTSMYGIYTLALSIINLFLVDFGLSTSGRKPFSHRDSQDLPIFRHRPSYHFCRCLLFD